VIFRPHNFTNDAGQYELGMDNHRLTVRPSRPEGDDFFGLTIGSNGTAATARREAVELEICATQNYVHGAPVWLRFNGKPAAGLQLVPGTSTDLETDPWGGEALTAP
jgi:hypothetical protein